MKNRREFLQDISQYLAVLTLAPLAGCGKQAQSSSTESLKSAQVLTRGEVTLYDTNAIAMYFDGSMGPKTGVIKVQYIIDNQNVTLNFWHGHGGILHRFTLTPAHYADLKNLKKVTLETTVVEGHKHKLFIDPNNARYRVAGAKPVVVTV
jgi:hypothetical protein